MGRKSKTPPDREKFVKMLRERGMRATAQRLAVHDAMMELVHASADMVSANIEERSACKVTTASVYNILSQLSDAGIYARRYSSNGKMYFDILTYPHLHLYDTRNNEFKDIPDEELVRLVEDHLKNRKIRGYRLDGFDLQLVCHPTRRKLK